MQVAPIVPIVTSTSRMLSKCCLSRCLSALLRADMPIRLFSSARTRSLTLLRVASELRGDRIGRGAAAAASS